MALKDPFYNNGGIIPLIHTPPLLKSRRSQQRQLFPSIPTVNLANQAITAVNELAVSFHSHSGSPTTPSSTDSLLPQSQQQPAQHIPFVKQLPPSSAHRVHQRVYSAAQRYSRHLQQHINATSGDRHEHSSSSFISSNLFKDIDRFQQSHLQQATEPMNNNHYTSPPPAKLIIADAVSLPSAAGTCNLMEVASPSIAATYADPLLLLRPSHEVKLSHKAFLCQPLEYRKLLIRMKSGGMLSFTQTPKCMNGMFGVAKGDKDIRLIIDCRPN